LKTWQSLYPFRDDLVMHVNVSGAQFADPDLLEHIRDALHDSGLPPRCLKLELTESVLMTLADNAVTILNNVKDLGVLVGIDDFGTGYSSLSYLHRFPVNTLKVDRSFVTGIDVENENGKIVRTIITLAHELGMDVVAEGVEDNSELHHLRALNCESAQGYFFSKPVPAREVLKLLREAP
jgi:EAL domain-containing protein (putative c-di-GMP-specific phosphodiesterase class I)